MKDDENPKVSSRTDTEQLIIPANHIICKVDLDAEEPYCEIVPFCNVGAEPKRLAIPKALAYYMTTHFCGSRKVVNRIANNARRSTQLEIREALGLET